MSAVTAGALRQRADYTHKFNVKTGRHGWLRLTPAYSVKIVEEIIGHCNGRMRILDPFCGTGTTGLSAAYHGHDATTVDINPFLVWLGRAKTGRYRLDAVMRTRDACESVLRAVNRRRGGEISLPPIHNIERWWSEDRLFFLAALRKAISEETDGKSKERTLLMVAFCRTLIKVSNAAFNHQSMSFKNENQRGLDIALDLRGVYRTDVELVLAGAEKNPPGACRVLLGDARDMGALTDQRFDLVVTSPPYANRMSYVRELRPYMYWLGFLENGRDAGELDWASIGGTWGIATSRLMDWSRGRTKYWYEVLENAVEKISDKENANGKIMANYVAKYFEDIWVHLENLRGVLADGARVHYIVGNSTFYGVMVPVEEIYSEMLRQLGFKDVKCRAVRKRNSKKELVEFDVSAVWPG